MTTRLHSILPLLLTSIVLGTLAGCGGSSAHHSASAAAPTATVDPATAPISTDLTRKPDIPAPTERPPAQLVQRDIVTGTGAVATTGRSATVQYVGVAWSTGKTFDASWDRSSPFTFPLGKGKVIKGWDQGVAGMKVGGRRLLIIPPDLGYGERGSGASIVPNETLIFVIDLKKVA